MISKPRDRSVYTWFLPLLASVVVPGATAHAQTTTSLLIQPALPYDFDRGRNVSVTERARPDYDPIGIRAGSFEIRPELGIATGYSSNIYYSSANEVDDGYVSIRPAVSVRSDWSRHRLRFDANSDIQRFFSHSRRNQTPWNAALQGVLQIGDLNLIPELQIARQYETPFSGETNANNAILSHYLRKYAGLRAEYSSGQSKLTLAADDTNYAFSDIRLPSGTRIDQSDRDRNLARITGQAQYAFTPSVSAYVQAGYIRTAYDRGLLNGDPNRDSDGYRFLGGFNLDMAGFLRGTIGLGYTRRSYDSSALYRTTEGFAAEGKLEYFPSELTTFTLEARRVLEDSNIASTSAFFDNRATLRVDHSLLRNLLVNAYGEYARQDYTGSSASFDVYRLGSGATFFSSNWLRFNASAAYTGRRGNNTFAGADLDEIRGQVGVTFMR